MKRLKPAVRISILIVGSHIVVGCTTHQSRRKYEFASDRHDELVLCQELQCWAERTLIPSLITSLSACSDRRRTRLYVSGHEVAL